MTQMIIDCDPGIDDAQAIMMAFRHPEVKIEAITTVAGNVDVDKTTANVLKIFDALNASGIPVYKGAASGLVDSIKNASFVHGSDGLGDCGIADSNREFEAEPAALALIRLAIKKPGELTLVAIGPLTNLALALKLDPNLPSYFKRLVIMGGAFLGQGNTQKLPVEFNFYADPDAAFVVFDNWPKFTMVSWETTVEHGIPLNYFTSLFQMNTPASCFIKKISEKSHGHIRKVLKRDKNFNADPLAMAIAIDPSIVLDSEEKYVQIERYGQLTQGMTVVDWFNQSGRKPNVEIVRKVNFEKFFELFRLAFI